MALPILFIMLLFVFAAGGAVGLTREEDSSYPRRLDAVKQVAHRFPGRLRPGASPYRDLGLLAGIYLQTKWQMDSGRDALSIWFLVNQSLTLAPLVYSQEYEANPHQPCEQSDYVRTYPTRDPDRAPLTQVATCRAWKEYFRASDAAAADLASEDPRRRLKGGWLQRTKVTQLLWDAHNTAIRHSIWQYAEEFTKVPVPEEELSFWRGWIRLVFFSEKVAPSTTDLLLRPFLVATMPERSPLGMEGFRIEDQPALRRAFLVWLTRGHIDRNRFLQIFGQPGARLTGDLEMLKRHMFRATSPGDAAVDPVVERLMQDVIDHHRSP